MKKTQLHTYQPTSQVKEVSYQPDFNTLPTAQGHLRTNQTPSHRKHDLNVQLKIAVLQVQQSQR